MSSVQVGLRVGCQCIPTLAHNSTRTVRPCIVALAPNTDARLPVYSVLGLCAYLLEMSELKVVYKKSEASSGGPFDMRCAIVMFDVTAEGESVFSRLPAQFQTEVGELLAAIFKREVGGTAHGTLIRFEISFYVAGQTGPWCPLRWHKDGDLKPDACGPLCADVCLRVCLGCECVRACLETCVSD